MIIECEVVTDTARQHQVRAVRHRRRDIEDQHAMAAIDGRGPVDVRDRSCPCGDVDVAAGTERDGARKGNACALHRDGERSFRDAAIAVDKSR